MLWNFTKSKCIAINQSLQMYIATIYLAMIQLYNLYTGVKGNTFVDHVKRSEERRVGKEC